MRPRILHSHYESEGSPLFVAASLDLDLLWADLVVSVPPAFHDRENLIPGSILLRQEGTLPM